ncbi:MAG: hypothetical protein ABIK96_07660 [bacterium]
MGFFTEPHQFYSDVDLHAQSIYSCIQDQQGRVRLNRNLPAEPECIREANYPFRPGIIIGAARKKGRLIVQRAPST